MLRRFQGDIEIIGLKTVRRHWSLWVLYIQVIVVIHCIDHDPHLTMVFSIHIVF